MDRHCSKRQSEKAFWSVSAQLYYSADIFKVFALVLVVEISTISGQKNGANAIVLDGFGSSVEGFVYQNVGNGLGMLTPVLAQTASGKAIYVPDLR